MIRHARVAGHFYPADPNELKKDIEFYFSESRDFQAGVIVPVHGIIAPHAGYIFSGKQAGKAYACLLGQSFDCVCVISPSHYDYFQGISVYPGDAYETPLGTLKIHEEARDLLLQNGIVVASEAGHGKEHALEVQLPFLQKALAGSFSILPLVMGSQDHEQIRLMTEGILLLREKFGDAVIFVASSDLSHFHTSSAASGLDGKCVDLISEFNADGLEKSLADGSVEACGGGPMVALLRAFASQPGIAIKGMGYSHSGEVLGDRESVVGYTSAVIYSSGGH